MVEREINNNRDFKGVWIPAKIWLDANLSIQETVFLTEIDSLDNGKSGCFASNKYFSTFFGLSTSRCSRVIASLKDKGYLNINYIRNGKEIDKRILRVNRQPIANAQQGIAKTQQGIAETPPRYCGNAQVNNTSNNTVNNTSNIKPLSSKPDPIPYTEIISYLNQVTGKSFKNVETHKKLIRSRWNEKATLSDFKHVIDNKSSEWLETDMAKYLQPSTLFGSKFDQYLNQTNVAKQKGGSYAGVEF
ncbi:conserved phage C-terminal domain-containing protein [Latilactobacillus fuchuensis]|uniref:conserved phage C-terminal domain-containing protein n=1 Tax=Latilactobacillus fuchuensis TaxID=164393 RepID=UPI0039B109CD